MFFDAHADILTDMYIQRKKGNISSFKKRHLDLYKRGGITHSIFVNWTDPDTKNESEFNDIFTYSLEEINENKDIFMICHNYQDMMKSMNENKIGIIIGIEGIKFLENKKHLQELYEKGVRHASLTWNEENKFAAGLDNLNTNGLSKEGEEIILEMQRLGMIIDLAHSNEKTFDDILNITTKPVIISHGNAKELCYHRRNYTDDQLRKIKGVNGVVGVCGIAPFISNDKTKHTLNAMVDHIDYIVSLIGIDHVGLGLDMCYYLFDNVEHNHLENLLTIGDTQNIVNELLNRGYSKDDIDKITHLNFFRIVKEILG